MVMHLSTWATFALLPAFVNAHTHLEFSHLPRPLGEPGMRMVDWIRLVIGDRGSRKTDANEFVAVGRAESRSAGVALLGDIVSDGGATAPVSVSDGEFTTATLPVTTLSFLEVIGFSRARATSVLNALEERLADFQSRSNAFAACGISPHVRVHRFARFAGAARPVGRSRTVANGDARWPRAATNSNCLPTAPARFNNCSTNAACGTRPLFRAVAGRSTIWCGSSASWGREY